MKLIAAIGLNNSLGFNGKLAHPKIKADLARFKQLTVGNLVVMGSTTFLKDLGGVPLKNRVNLVLTSKNIAIDQKNLRITRNIPDALQIIDSIKLDCYIIGGQLTYTSFMPFVDEMIITHIKQNFEADTYLNIDWMNWKITYIQEFEQYNFVNYVRAN
jgi:dihydrofolate reductase